MIEVELFEENILRNIGVQNFTDSLPLYHTMPYKSRSSVISQQMGFLEKFHSKLKKFHSTNLLWNDRSP